MSFSKLPSLDEVNEAIALFRTASVLGVHISAHVGADRTFQRVEYFLPKGTPRDALKRMASAEAVALAGASRDIMASVAQAVRAGLPVLSDTTGQIVHFEHHVHPGRDLDDPTLPSRVVGHAFLALLAANNGAASATLDRHNRLDFWVWRRTGCTTEQTMTLSRACEDLLQLPGAREAVIGILKERLHPDWRSYDWTPRHSVEDDVPAAPALETAA